MIEMYVDSLYQYPLSIFIPLKKQPFPFSFTFDRVFLFQNSSNFTSISFASSWKQKSRKQNLTIPPLGGWATKNKQTRGWGLDCPFPHGCTRVQRSPFFSLSSFSIPLAEHCSYSQRERQLEDNKQAVSSFYLFLSPSIFFFLGSAVESHHCCRENEIFCHGSFRDEIKLATV